MWFSLCLLGAGNYFYIFALRSSELFFVANLFCDETSFIICICGMFNKESLLDLLDGFSEHKPEKMLL